MLAHCELMHSDLQRKVMPLFRHHRHTRVSRKDRQSRLCCISWPVRPQSSACRSCIKRFAPHVITTVYFVNHSISSRDPQAWHRHTRLEVLDVGNNRFTGVFSNDSDGGG